MREIALFVEDFAHQKVIGALVQRLADEYSTDVSCKAWTLTVPSVRIDPFRDLSILSSMYFSNGNAKQIVASCNAYPLDLFFFQYHLSDSFDNTSWIFGRAQRASPLHFTFRDSALLLPFSV